MKVNKTARKKILIADDSAEIRKRLVALLPGLERVEIVGPASDGSEGLRLFNRFAPHGAVLDFQMPGLNGLELLAAIRRQDKSRLVVIPTNHDDEEFRDQCLEAGANFYLDKTGECERVRDIFQTNIKSSL
jgi:DNA-binding NarL/FixJ family response regulator